MEGNAQVTVRHYRPMAISPFAVVWYSRGNGFVREFKDKPTFWKTAPTPKGGKTIATTKVNGKSYTGYARCSMQDGFCYRMGRTIALGRLHKQLELAGMLDKVEWPS